RRQRCVGRRRRGALRLFRRRVAADEDLRPLEARTREPRRGPGDRDRVRLDDRRARRLRGRGRPVPQPDHQPGRKGGVMATVNVAEIPKIDVDPVTLDIIEGALKSTRFEMDATLFRTAMSPVIREQHDEFPMITDPNGRMVVGQFGSYISGMLETFGGPIVEGDVIFNSDPYKSRGSTSHLPYLRLVC